jgi:hypothetical protein
MRKSAGVTVMLLGIGYLLFESRRFGWHDINLAYDPEETICDGLGFLILSLGLITFNWKD